MLVSTAALLLKAITQDHNLVKHLIKREKPVDKEEGFSLFSSLGLILAAACAGPLIAAVIEHVFGEMFGSKDKDKDKKPKPEPDPTKEELAESTKVREDADSVVITDVPQLPSAPAPAPDVGRDKGGDKSKQIPKPAPKESKSAWSQIKEGLGLSKKEVKPIAPIGPRSSSGRVTTGSSVASTVTKSNLGVPTKEVDNAIRAAALKENIDYSLLYAVAGAESTFREKASASTSSAQGLFQFTASTWADLTKKVYPELKYKPKDRNDPHKSAVVASKYLKSIQSNLTKYLGKAPTIGQIYLGYFMGPTGARKFLGEYGKNKTQLGEKLFPAQAKANVNLFYDQGTPMTLVQTLDKLEGKVGVYYAQASTGDNQVQVAQAQSKTPTSKTKVKGLKPGKGDSGEGDSIVPVGVAVVAKAAQDVVTPGQFPVPKVDTKARQVAQTITPADLPPKARVERYAQAEIEEPQVLPPMSGASTSKEITYIRDRQNRITAIQG